MAVYGIFVSVPEQGGGKLIPEGMCNPGQVYTGGHSMISSSCTCPQMKQWLRLRDVRAGPARQTFRPISDFMDN